MIPTIVIWLAIMSATEAQNEIWRGAINLIVDITTTIQKGGKKWKENY